MLSSNVSDLVAHSDKLSVDVLILLSDVVHLSGEWFAYPLECDLDCLHVGDHGQIDSALIIKLHPHPFLHLCDALLHRLLVPLYHLVRALELRSDRVDHSLGLLSEPLIQVIYSFGVLGGRLLEHPLGGLFKHPCDRRNDLFLRQLRLLFNDDGRGLGRGDQLGLDVLEALVNSLQLGLHEGRQLVLVLEDLPRDLLTHRFLQVGQSHIKFVALGARDQLGLGR